MRRLYKHFYLTAAADSCTTKHMAARKLPPKATTWNDRFRERRIRLDLSQAFVAERAKVTQQAVSRFENGEIVPRLSTLEAYATALGTTIEELFPLAARPKKAA